MIKNKSKFINIEDIKKLNIRNYDLDTFNFWRVNNNIIDKLLHDKNKNVNISEHITIVPKNEDVKYDKILTEADKFWDIFEYIPYGNKNEYKLELNWKKKYITDEILEHILTYLENNHSILSNLEEIIEEEIGKDISYASVQNLAFHIIFKGRDFYEWIISNPDLIDMQLLYNSYELYEILYE